MNSKRFIKIGVSVVLIALMLQFIDLKNLWTTLLTIPPLVALTVVLGYLLGQVVSALKWWLIAKNSGIDASFGFALRAYFIGMFTNCFGFGIVGGDLARALLLGRGREQKAAAVASVFADRAHGLGTLAGLGVCAALLVGSTVAGFELTVLLVAVGILIAIGWIFGPRILSIVSHRVGKLEHIAAEIEQAFPRRPSLVISITAISVGFHSMHILLHWVMGTGFGIELPLGYLFVAIPFVNILSALPISWNGLGVRENAYIFFLAPVIMTPEQAAAMGALWLVAVTVSAAVGGLLAVLTHDFERLKKIESQLSPPESAIKKSAALRPGAA